MAGAKTLSALATTRYYEHGEKTKQAMLDDDDGVRREGYRCRLYPRPLPLRYLGNREVRPRRYRQPLCRALLGAAPAGQRHLSPLVVGYETADQNGSNRE